MISRLRLRVNGNFMCAFHTTFHHDVIYMQYNVCLYWQACSGEKIPLPTFFTFCFIWCSVMWNVHGITPSFSLSVFSLLILPFFLHTFFSLFEVSIVCAGIYVEKLEWKQLNTRKFPPGVWLKVRSKSILFSLLSLFSPFWQNMSLIMTLRRRRGRKKESHKRMTGTFPHHRHHSHHLYSFLLMLL